MIFYYTGTGNSRYIARRLAAALGDELFDMNDRIKRGDRSPVAVNGRAVFVTPTYAWRIPRIVREWIAGTALDGAEGAWFVMSCGSEIGSAARYNRALCAEKGFRYMGTAQVVMPENYIAMFNAPDDAEAARIIAAADPVIAQTARTVGEGRAFPAPRCSVYDRFMSGVVNRVFYPVLVRDKAFTADDKCISCGKCAALCPTNDITLENGRPVWHGRCTHCMACICRCPTGAIEYGRKSLGKPRYHCDE